MLATLMAVLLLRECDKAPPRRDDRVPRDDRNSNPRGDADDLEFATYVSQLSLAPISLPLAAGGRWTTTLAWMRPQMR